MLKGADVVRPYFIFDLDGTLALIDHRRPILDSNDDDKWNKFFMACDADEPNYPVIRVMQSLVDSGYGVKIFSGRGVIAQEKTIEWLIRYVGREYVERIDIRMRSEGDFTPGYNLKKRWFLEMNEEERKGCLGVFDDLNNDVKMWRDLGLACFQVTEYSY
jgi:hypothetical protein